MNNVLIGIFSGLFLINFFTLIIVGSLLSCEYDACPPILCQQYLWSVLDDKDINFIGKLILCILTTPFTVLYTVGLLSFKIGSFVIINIWKLFCVLFKKR